MHVGVWIPVSPVRFKDTLWAIVDLEGGAL